MPLSINHSRQAHVLINGKPLLVEWSRRADHALQSRNTPLIVELELYFSCLIKKFVHFRSEAAARTLTPVNDRLTVYFRPVMSTACSPETAKQLGRQPETEITTEAVHRIAPKRLWIDNRHGEWVGEFWL